MVPEEAGSGGPGEVRLVGVAVVVEAGAHSAEDLVLLPGGEAALLIVVLVKDVELVDAVVGGAVEGVVVSIIEERGTIGGGGMVGAPRENGAEAEAEGEGGGGKPGVEDEEGEQDEEGGRGGT